MPAGLWGQEGRVHQPMGEERVSRPIASGAILQQGEERGDGFPDKQLPDVSHGGGLRLQEQVEHRAVFPLDKTPSHHQQVLWHVSERRLHAGVRGDHGLLPGGDGGRHVSFQGLRL